MRITNRMPFVIVAMLALSSGCGGRGGSSGLDISENAAIDRAREQHRCIDYEGLTICPADEPAPSTPGLTPTPATDPSIATSVTNATSIGCYQSAPGALCVFRLTFTPQGFTSGTSYRLLARAGVAVGPWVLGGAPIAVGSDPDTFEATVALISARGLPPEEIQFAILAFAAAAPGAAEEVGQLGETTADYAFVTQVLTVQALLPTMTPSITAIATRTATPTATAGANDCCQCASSCAAPIAGVCDSSCTVVYGTSCFGGRFCVVSTPAATPTPTPILDCFVDNGDGTISDTCSGRMWEKKEERAGAHDFADRYAWAALCTFELECDDPNAPGLCQTLLPCQPGFAASDACARATNGVVGCSECPEGARCELDPSISDPTTPTVWAWLAKLNAENFAGHSDWRLPVVDGELESLLTTPCQAGTLCTPEVFHQNCDPGALCSATRPCREDQICVQRADTPSETCQDVPGCSIEECSCTWAQHYWSGETSFVPASNRYEARLMEFSSGISSLQTVRSAHSVRAVRGAVGVSPGVSTPTPTPTPCLSDNRDGTIIDNCRGLVWEKKDRAGGVHDVDSIYTWAGACSGGGRMCQPNAGAAAACSAQTGGADGCSECPSGSCIVDPLQFGAVTTIWDWVHQLNIAGFSGYDDWRIPTVGFDGTEAEFETILRAPNPCEGFSPPCVVPLFHQQCEADCELSRCSCTRSDSYWTATSTLAQPGAGWVIDFTFAGFGQFAAKTNAYAARAVRGGRP